MKQTTYYPTGWVTMPITLDLAAQFDSEGRRIKELILNSSCADELKVSKMDLNIVKFSALDENGQEHAIIDFPACNTIEVKGICEGHFIKSSSVASLRPGRYLALRYYLGQKNNFFTYSDGVREEANEFEFLDFEIQNGMLINGDENFETKLWFNFAPYKFSRHFRPFKEWYKKVKYSNRQIISNRA